jgi:hypothetical protein
MRSIRFGYDNPRQVPGEHNPVEHTAAQNIPIRGSS